VCHLGPKQPHPKKLYWYHKQIAKPHYGGHVDSNSFPIVDRTGEFTPFAKLPLPNVFMNKNSAEKEQKTIDMLLEIKKNTQKDQWDLLAPAHNVIRKTTYKS
jgi:hypothetical protein